MAKVAIIIVNWNGLAFIKDCLDSLKKQTYKNFSIYFVDNGSHDDSVNYVKKNYPEIRLIALENNLGFAGGNNRGIKEALLDKEIEYIATLNNDTKAQDNWLASLVEVAVKDKKIGAVGSKMMFFDNPKIINSTAMIPFFDGQGMDRGIWQEDKGQYEKEDEVFGVCAGAALYCRPALEIVGLFDEDYFLYAEDTDLAWRIRLAGFKAYYAPQAVIYHKQAISTGRFASKTVYYVVRNGLWNTFKNFPMPYCIFALLYSPFRLLKIALSSINGQDFRKGYLKKESKFSLLLLIIKAYFHGCSNFIIMSKKRKKIMAFKTINNKEFVNIFKKYSSAK